MSDATIAMLTSNVYGVASSMEQSTVFSLSDCFPRKIIVSFKEVKVDRRVFQLNRPLDLLLDRGDDGWSCEEPILALFGFGKKSVNAICSVFEDFSVLWDEIAQVPDDVLSEDAQRTKRELLALVKSVQEV
jgi:hypothetical protein